MGIYELSYRASNKSHAESRQYFANDYDDAVEQPDPLPMPIHTPKAKKPRMARPKPAKKSNFVYRPTAYWYPAQGISYA